MLNVSYLLAHAPLSLVKSLRSAFQCCHTTPCWLELCFWELRYLLFSIRTRFAYGSMITSCFHTYEQKRETGKGKVPQKGVTWWLFFAWWREIFITWNLDLLSDLSLSRLKAVTIRSSKHEFQKFDMMSWHLPNVSSSYCSLVGWTLRWVFKKKAINIQTTHTHKSKINQKMLCKKCF